MSPASVRLNFKPDFKPNRHESKKVLVRECILRF